ncbi:glucose-6-phosphate isomerase [Ferrimonas balearica]|uniref:glucose-6-phosphate isomerase n=1 Tax=Ferrimonas balearica TaxID=44012 RepID=UPI001C5903CA|nr:glucose-6-phosphate isomerase [Ferrimonas balearica]MBW3140787.1 glucose-6-phosphate isomerase [Ferrimonas balearica]MBY6107409.1 glucose-6-phosphate isomerase [Ferrimonas balearica]
MSALTALPAWQALSQHRDTIESTHLRDLFAQDPSRAERYQLHAAGLFLDYAKNRINDDTIALLCQLARETGVEALRDAMFRGDVINNTEGRPVLHTALRYSGKGAIQAQGEDAAAEVRDTLKRMKAFVEAIHSQSWKGYDGDAFTDVVSIGIGGSFLGPKIMSEALRPYWRGDLRCHFVANIDGTALTEKLKKLDPKRTLILMSSKSFTTQETLTNTESARQWFLDSGAPESAIGQHFVAVSANVPAAEAFGIKAENVYPMWDWVGGRYSLWSAIGLPIALLVGFDHFEALLRGAEAMDTHFREAPLEQNMPALMGLLSLWYTNFFNSGSQVILTYDHYLRGLPAYVQQLDMESNGKGVNKEGEPMDCATGPVIWGGEGTNGQHAYHQLLHQGSGVIPADFILPLQSHNPLGRHHAMLASNCLAQTQALMQGKTQAEAEAELAGKGLEADALTELARHKVMPGNKPSNTLLMDKLTPHTLGALVALYEHRTFVQGAVWGINSFDQWGVELGKVLGNAILDELESEQPKLDQDSSTANLIRMFRKGQIN